MRYRDGRRSVCVSSQSGCPLTCTFCATGAMKFGRNLTASRDPRPGAALPPHRAARPPRVHGHGRADDEPRQRARRRAPAARHRHHAPPHRHLHRRLGAGHPRADREPTCRSGSRSRCTRPRTRCARRSCRSTSATRLAEVLEACEAFYARRRRQVFIEYVMLAGVNDSYAQARPARRAARPADLQAQPDPVQPDRRGLRRLLARRDRRVQGRARGARPARHGPPHPRPRHRRRLRPARRGEAGRAARRGALEPRPRASAVAPALPLDECEQRSSARAQRTSGVTRRRRGRADGRRPPASDARMSRTSAAHARPRADQRLRPRLPRPSRRSPACGRCPPSRSRPAAQRASPRRPVPPSVPAAVRAASSPARRSIPFGAAPGARPSADARVVGPA